MYLFALRPRRLTFYLSDLRNQRQHLSYVLLDRVEFFKVDCLHSLSLHRLLISIEFILLERKMNQSQAFYHNMCIKEEIGPKACQVLEAFGGGCGHGLALDLWFIVPHP